MPHYLYRWIDFLIPLLQMKKLFGAALVVCAVFFTGCTQITEDAAKERASNFINSVLIAPGTTAEIKEISTEGGVFKLLVETQGKEIVSYMSGDGNMFFPSVMDIEMMLDEKAASLLPKEVTQKTEKPVVDLFVMSHCPYGTQIEKGIIPVIKELGDSIDFNLKFVNYAMHGEKEVREQVTQYCIEKNQNENFLPYLECFLGTDGAPTAGEACLAEFEIDSEALASCTEETDTEFNITANLEDQSGQLPRFMIHDTENKKYGIAGSPALVINEQVIDKAGRNPKELLRLICSAFEEKPEACAAELPEATPAAGFGWKGGGAATDASCG